MNKLVRLINFLRSGSHLQRRQLKTYLESVEAEYTDLLLHNDIRWLSKGNVLCRLWSIHLEIIEYLKKSKKKGCDEYILLLGDERTTILFAFLVDIFQHINALNLKLQGKKCCVFEMYIEICTFNKQLQLFHDDLNNGDYSHFEALDELHQAFDKVDLEIIHTDCCTFINKLTSEIASRFENLDNSCKEMNLLFANPFTVDIRGAWKTSVTKFAFKSNINKSKLQLELTHLQENEELKVLFASEPIENFYVNLNKETYQNIHQMGIQLLTLMGTTWICESGFSKMNYIKNKYRSRITQNHLCGAFRTAVSSLKPEFNELIKVRKLICLIDIFCHIVICQTLNIKFCQIKCNFLN